MTSELVTDVIHPTTTDEIKPRRARRGDKVTAGVGQPSLW